MITVEELRKSIRISHTALDDDIQRNINTCLLDLKRVGIDTDKDNALQEKACELYCKWQFDFMGQGERFQKNYEQLRDSMSLSEEYRQGRYGK